MRLAGIVCVAVLMAGFLVWSLASAPAGSREKRTAAPTTAPTTTPVAIGVEELMRHVERYPGPQRVEGVVSVVDASSHGLALIDREEFRQCKELGCAELVLPVQWKGTMPPVGATLRVSGEVREVSGKRLFIADSIEVVP